MTNPQPVEDGELLKRLEEVKNRAFLMFHDHHEDGDLAIAWFAEEVMQLFSAQQSKHQEELKAWDDMLDRAAKGEVVKVVHDGTELAINSLDGMHDGMSRVVETAMSLGEQVAKHKHRTGNRPQLTQTTKYKTDVT